MAGYQAVLGRLRRYSMDKNLDLFADDHESLGKDWLTG